MSGIRGFVTGDERGAARALGGLLLGVAALVILFRRGDLWDPFPIFLLLAVPAAFLYAGGVAGARLAGTSPTGWQTVFAIFGTVLAPFALFAFVDLLGGDTNSALNTAWIFALTALLAFLAAIAAGVRAGCLIGGFATAVAWLALWDEILDEGIGTDLDTLRILLLALAFVLLVIALAFAARGRPEAGARDLVTVAGLAAISAGAVMFAQGLFFTFAPVSAEDLPDPSALSTGTFWEIELLAVSLALVAGGALAAARGPIYAGVLGLFAFTYLIGTDFGDFEADGSLAGWPLVLVVAALGLLAWSAIPSLRRPRA